MSENNNSKKKGFFLFRWLKRAFFPNKEMEDMYKEEQLESPFRMVIKNFVYTIPSVNYFITPPNYSSKFIYNR